MFPLGFLNVCKKDPILVETKQGYTFNGILEEYDQWMNLRMSNVIKTSEDGEHFWKLGMVYVRGNAIKYIRFPEKNFDKASAIKRQNMSNASNPRKSNRKQ